VTTGIDAPRVRTRRVASALLWLAVAGQWLLAWFVPWTSRGLLSTSSLADGARLIRGGSVSALVPSWAAWVLLVAPACALAVLGSATREGSVVVAIRCVTVLVMAAVFAVAFQAFARLDLTRLGPGGWLTLSGLALGLAGILEQRHSTRLLDRGKTDHE
jgi:hypothetical protein